MSNCTLAYLLTMSFSLVCALFMAIVISNKIFRLEGILGAQERVLLELKNQKDKDCLNDDR